MATSKPKLSRAEREDRRAMLRMLVLGGGALAVLGAAGAGLYAMTEAPELEGTETLGARLEAAQIKPYAYRLLGEGEPDVVIVGSTDCVHCQRFVAEGIEGFLAEAQNRDLTVDYFALPTGPGSIASAHMLDCVANPTDKVAALRATYAYSAEVTGGLDSAERDERMAELLRNAGVNAQTAACAGGLDEGTITARGRTIATALSLQGTPGFYVATAADPESIRMFSGYANMQGVVRQLIQARDS